jgi:hypothetical protein
LHDLWRNTNIKQFLGRVISNEEVEGKIDSIQNHGSNTDSDNFLFIKIMINKLLIFVDHYSKGGVEISYMFSPVSWAEYWQRELY